LSSSDEEEPVKGEVLEIKEGEKPPSGVWFVEKKTVEETAEEPKEEVKEAADEESPEKEE
jgi:hypothetical protein